MSSRLGDFEITVEDDIRAVCRLGIIEVRPVRVVPSPPSLVAKIHVEVAQARERHSAGEPGSIRRVTAVREMYRRLHMDPHHTRPSSEALLRRVLRGQELPRINCIVDAANLWSLLRLCPIGLYDADRVEPPISLRLGSEGEGYVGIGRPWVNVEGRPVLVDALGGFGNPTADSARASVKSQTTAILAVVFQPVDYPPKEVDELEQELRAIQVDG